MDLEPVESLAMAMQLIANLAHFTGKAMRLSLECKLKIVYLTLI
jgi:hypothetical protein